MTTFRLLSVCMAIGSAFPALAVTYQVRQGESLQSYLDSAVPNDTIELQAGATFTGNFILRKKVGSGLIYVRSSQAASLPARVSPADAPKMAKIVTPRDLPAFSTELKAKGYMLKGLEITVAPGVYTWSLVSLGSGDARVVSDLGSDITVAQCYIHGDPRVGTKNGITLNLSQARVSGSYISDIKSTFQDAHAILGFNGPGPFRIENNYLEASGENIMFGGGRANIPNLVPSDILIRNNTIRKPLRWKTGSADYEGTPWIIKNHVELKNAQRVTIDRNLMENCWAQGQSGASILLTVRTEDGAMPWAVVQDVTITNNLVRHVSVGILGHSADYGGGIGRRWTIRNNVFEDVSTAYGGNLGGTFLAIASNVTGVTVDHNTAFAERYSVYHSSAASPGLIYTNNIGTGDYCGDGLGCNSALVNTLRPVVSGNVFIGQLAFGLPFGNTWASSVSAVGFVDPAQSLYQLRPDSQFRLTATNGTNPGADLNPATLPK